MRNLAVLLISCALVANPALAQTPPAAPPSAADPAAVAQADALLEAAKATDLFENITDDKVARVRHKASGLVCGFDKNDPTARVTIFANPVRGNDVGCTSKMADVLISLYATKYPPEANLQAEFRATLGVMRSIYPDIKGYEGAIASMSSDSAPKDETTYFVITDKEGRITGKPGTEVISRLSMALVKDGWMLKIRGSTANSGDQAAMNLSVASSVVWMGTLMESAPPKTAEPAALKPADSPPTL